MCKISSAMSFWESLWIKAFNNDFCINHCGQEFLATLDMWVEKQPGSSMLAWLIEWHDPLAMTYIQLENWGHVPPWNVPHLAKKNFEFERMKRAKA